HFQLPTDIFDSSHYLVAMGAGVKTRLNNTDVFAFAGATSSDFNSPLFEGARAESPAGILFLNRKMARGWQASSKMVFSHQTTAIESLQWEPKEKLKLAVSGGVGANQPYEAASLDFLRPWIDVKAAYIEAGSNFHRVAVQQPLMSEPDRENVDVTLRPSKYFSISAGRNNYLSPLDNSQTNVRSSVNQVSGSVQIHGASLSASVFDSKYLGNSNRATAYAASRSFYSRARVTASYLESRPTNGSKTRTFLTDLTETLTPRLDVSEFVTRSAGQTSVSFGGSWLSNPISISANYQTYYVPERNSSPFEQALIVDVNLHLFRGLSLHGASFVAPDGSLKYTADSQAVMARQGAMPIGDNGYRLAQSAIGKNVIRGTVVDSSGQPVAGAAVMIDKLLIYTNDDGSFLVREKKPHVHALKVMTDQFLGAGAYSVVSAPAAVRSDAENSTPRVEIVVAKMMHDERNAHGGQ
ncbi:MAG TPA: carboxypeptidase-like regulatory domain-containing protein, partial [Terracidiphilus sp.]|nr:carboxypeptidase-like regulatory domain-containing protein [Terracidiphilus sp.]